MNYGKRWCTPLLAGLVIALSSCIGVKADITLRQQGSGTLEMEYRLSRLAESLGKLDGNEKMPTIPLGKADFERTIARIEGLTLSSFSTSNDGKDTINRVKMEFSSLQGLVRFLDATGQRAALFSEQGKNRLSLTLLSSLADLDPDLLILFIAVSQGYGINLSLTAPHEGTLTLVDTRGKSLGEVPGITIVPKGKKVSFQSPLENIFTLQGGVGIELTWE